VRDAAVLAAWAANRRQFRGAAARREGDKVRLFTRRGYDWSGRYPAIVVTAVQLHDRTGAAAIRQRRHDFNCNYWVAAS
jgi:hypothetical protein